MEDYTSPKHSTETLDFDEFYAEWGEDSGIPRWKARRLSVSMSHKDYGTKILEF